MSAPFFCGTAASATATDIMVLDGCIEKTNSKVARTPSCGRSEGSRASLSITPLRSHGGVAPALSKALSAPSALSVLVLQTGQDGRAADGVPTQAGTRQTCLSTKLWKSCTAWARSPAAVSGSKALRLAS